MEREIQAVVRYDNGAQLDCFSSAEIENLKNVDQIRKITFYNDAQRKVETQFLVPRVMLRHDYLTHVGETAQFIVYNW